MYQWPSSISTPLISKRLFLSVTATDSAQHPPTNWFRYHLEGLSGGLVFIHLKSTQHNLRQLERNDQLLGKLESD